MARLAKFTIDPTPAKPTVSSKTVLTNGIIFLLAFLPALKDFLESVGVSEVSIYILQGIAFLNIILRFLTSGPVAGVGAAVGFGIKAGTKKVVNVIPGVNLK